MVERPTNASVTDVPCSCEYLQAAADDPRNPIVFDPQTNEYQFTYPESECYGPSMLVIYHCPFCGGVAPASKRDLLFAVIPQEEEQRLYDLLAPVHSLDAAIACLGQPDLDAYSTSRYHEKDEQPPTVDRFRTLRYERPSSVSDVWITERPDGKVHCSLQGKPISR